MMLGNLVSDYLLSFQGCNFQGLQFGEEPEKKH